MDHAALTEMEFFDRRRIFGEVVLLGIFAGVQVIEDAEEFVEPVVGRQMFVAVAEVVLAELPRRVAQRLEEIGDRRVFWLRALRRPGSPTVLRPERMGYCPRMNAARPAVHDACP